jgi:hypothetical protein
MLQMTQWQTGAPTVVRLSFGKWVSETSDGGGRLSIQPKKRRDRGCLEEEGGGRLTSPAGNDRLMMPTSDDRINEQR